MSKYKIKELAEEISQRINDPKTSGYDKFIGLEHYDSGMVTINRFGSTSNLDSSVKIFKNGDILIARRNVYLKRAGLVNFDGVTSGDSIVLRAKNENLKKLLPFIFNTKRFWDFANQFADGSMSKRLAPKTLMEYEVEIPDSVEEQTKLANLLWGFYNTKYSYKKLLDKSDEVILARFIELFVDCTFPKIKLKNAIDYEQPTKYIVSDTQYNDEFLIPVLTAGKSFILGYTNEMENIYDGDKQPVLIFDDFTTDIRYVDFKFKVKSSAMKLLHLRNKSESLIYYFYAIKSLNYQPTNHQRHWISIISELEIPDVPVTKQKDFETFVLCMYENNNHLNECLQNLEKLYDKILEFNFTVRED